MSGQPTDPARRQPAPGAARRSPRLAAPHSSRRAVPARRRLRPRRRQRPPRPRRLPRRRRLRQLPPRQPRPPPRPRRRRLLPRQPRRPPPRRPRPRPRRRRRTSRRPAPQLHRRLHDPVARRGHGGLEGGDRRRRHQRQRRLRLEADQAGRHHRDAGLVLRHDVHDRRPTGTSRSSAPGSCCRSRRTPDSYGQDLERLLRRRQGGADDLGRRPSRAAAVREPVGLDLEQAAVHEDRRGPENPPDNYPDLFKLVPKFKAAGIIPSHPAVARDAGDPVRAAVLHVHLQLDPVDDVQPGLHADRRSTTTTARKSSR